VLTKLIGALAGVMLLAGNAWAFNDDRTAFDVCYRDFLATGISTSICLMQGLPENEAHKIAIRTLKICSNNLEAPFCAQEMEYVSRRWGY